MTYIKVDARPIEDSTPKFSFKVILLLLVMLLAISLNVMVFADANTNNISADVTNMEQSITLLP